MGQAITESAPTVDAVRVGSTLSGRYRLVRLLGEGGAGRVFEAVNTNTGRRVALKVLRPEFASQPAIVRRFRREAVTSSQVEHPNVVDVLDMGEDVGTFYIVQEMLSGIDLRTWLDHRQRLPVAEALELLVPIMSALVAAHRKGIIHRDVKPENIFLVRNASGAIVPKLIDFGVAKLMQRDSMAPPSARTTLAGTVFGTPAYMSPEQARGTEALDERTDVWSVGAVFYELLTGRAPFDAPTHNLLMVRIITEPVPRIEGLAPEVSPVVAEIVHTALEPDPEKRFRSMRHMLSALLESSTYHHHPDGAAAVDEHVFEELAPVSRATTPIETRIFPQPILQRLRLSPFAQGALGALVVSLSVFGLQRAFVAPPPAVAAPIRASMPVTVVPATPLCPQTAPAPALAMPPALPPPVAPMVAQTLVSPVRPVVTRRTYTPRAPVSRSPAPAARPASHGIGGFSHAGPLRPASSYPE